MQQIFKCVALEDKYTYYKHVRNLSYERYNNIKPLLNHKRLYVNENLNTFFHVSTRKKTTRPKMVTCSNDNMTF